MANECKHGLRAADCAYCRANTPAAREELHRKLADPKLYEVRRKAVERHIHGKQWYWDAKKRKRVAVINKELRGTAAVHDVSADLLRRPLRGALSEEVFYKADRNKLTDHARKEAVHWQLLREHVEAGGELIRNNASPGEEYALKERRAEWAAARTRLEALAKAAKVAKPVMAALVAHYVERETLTATATRLGVKHRQEASRLLQRAIDALTREARVTALRLRDEIMFAYHDA